MHNYKEQKNPPMPNSNKLRKLICHKMLWFSSISDNRPSFKLQISMFLIKIACPVSQLLLICITSKVKSGILFVYKWKKSCHFKDNKKCKIFLKIIILETNLKIQVITIKIIWNQIQDLIVDLFLNLYHKILWYI